KDELGVADQPQRHVEAPLLAPRQRFDARVRLLGQADEVEDLIGGPGRRIETAVQVDQLRHRKQRGHLCLLQYQAYALAKPPPASTRVDAEHADATAVAVAVALEDF